MLRIAALAAPSPTFRPLAVLTIRGPYVMIHDTDVAREFLAPLLAAHLASIPAGAAFPVTVQSPPGEGWRSKLLAKRAKHQNDMDIAGVGGPLMPGVAPYHTEDEEVSVRLAALEPSIRSQVKAQFAGSPTRSSRGLIPRDKHVLAKMQLAITTSLIRLGPLPRSLRRRLV